MEEPTKKKPKPKLVELKTKASTVNVIDFINSIENETKRNDSLALLELMKKGRYISAVRSCRIRQYPLHKKYWKEQAL